MPLVTTLLDKPARNVVQDSVPLQLCTEVVETQLRASTWDTAHILMASFPRAPLNRKSHYSLQQTDLSILL